MSSPLIIVGADFGAADVKNTSCSLISWQDWNPNNLTLDSANFNAYFGNPLPQWQKTYVVLFYFANGSDPRQNARISIKEERTGILNIISSSSGAPLPQIAPKTGASFEILALVYGPKLITNQNVYAAVYNGLINDGSFGVSNANMGGDTWPTIRKSAVLFIKDNDTASIRTIGAAEGDRLTL